MRNGDCTVWWITCLFSFSKEVFKSFVHSKNVKQSSLAWLSTKKTQRIFILFGYFTRSLSFLWDEYFHLVHFWINFPDFFANWISTDWSYVWIMTFGHLSECRKWHRNLSNCLSILFVFCNKTTNCRDIFVLQSCNLLLFYILKVPQNRFHMKI